MSFAGDMSSVDAVESTANRPPVWDWDTHLVATRRDPLDDVVQAWPFRSQLIRLDFFSDNPLSLGIRRPGTCGTPPPRREQRGRHLRGAELRDKAIQCRTADSEFSSRSPHRSWIKTCSTCGQKGADDVSPTFGDSPGVVPASAPASFFASNLPPTCKIHSPAIRGSSSIYVRPGLPCRAEAFMLART